MISRRQFLAAGAQTAAAALLAPACTPPPTEIPLPDVGADEDTTALPPDFLCATFEVGEDSAIAWTAAASASAVSFELWPEGEKPYSEGAVDLRAASGLVGAHRFERLIPDREYRYRAVFSTGGYGPWLRFRTRPTEGYVAPVSLLYSADIGFNAELYDIFDGLSLRSADMYLSLGDWPYSDKYPAARSLEEFRARHLQVRAPDPIQRFLWNLPVIAIYDDHDIQNGWTRALEYEDRELLENGLRVWREYFPTTSTVHYRDFRWGQLAHFFVLDTRRYRDDPLSTPAETRQFLGEQQFGWLSSGLAGSDAVFKFIVTSVPFDFNGTIDDWGAFEVEKTALREFVAAREITNVVFLSADRHWFAARHMPDGLREYQVGPLAAGLGMYPDTFPPSVVASARTRNYGVVTVSADSIRQAAVLRFECRDARHEVIFEETVEAPLV